MASTNQNQVPNNTARNPNIPVGNNQVRGNNNQARVNNNQARGNNNQARGNNTNNATKNKITGNGDSASARARGKSLAEQAQSQGYAMAQKAHEQALNMVQQAQLQALEKAKQVAVSRGLQFNANIKAPIYNSDKIVIRDAVSNGLYARNSGHAIVELNSVYFLNRMFGCTWKLYQLVVYEPQNLKGFQFIV